MKRAFLDLDGTLLNSKERHCNVLRDVLIQYGFGNRQVLDFVEYKANGKNTRQYLEDVHGFSKDIADKISTAWINSIEEEKYLCQDKWYEDAAVFVDFLKNRGYECFIITARKNDEYVTKFVKESYVGDSVQIIAVSTRNAVSNKISVIKKLLVDDNIMVGDTEVDYETGKTLKIRTYPLNRGFRSKNFWMAREIQSYDDLMSVQKAIEKD